MKFISVDDGFNPAKTVEQTRRLIESEEVLLMFGSYCTAANTAVHKYLNARKVPQLFIATTALKWDDPQHYFWTMAMLPPPTADTPLYARYLLKHHPNARLAILTLDRSNTTSAVHYAISLAVSWNRARPSWRTLETDRPVQRRRSREDDQPATLIA